MSESDRTAEAAMIGAGDEVDVSAIIAPAMPTNGESGTDGASEAAVLKAQLQALKLQLGGAKAREAKAKAEAQAAKLETQAMRGAVGVATGSKAPVQPKSQLSRMFPSSGERIQVFKRVDDGTVAGRQEHLADYSAQDLAGHVTMESFLRSYLVPKKGPGEYTVVLLSEAGVEQRRSAHLLGGLDHEVEKRPQTMESIAAEILGELAKKGRLPEPLNAVTQAPQSPLEARLDRLERLLSQQAPQQTAEQTVIAKLLTKLDKQDQPAMPMFPPMPPSPPPVDVGQVVKDTILNLIPIIKPAEAPQRQDTMGPRELIEFAERLRPPPEPKENVLDGLAKLAQLKQTLFGESTNDVARLKEQNEALKEQLQEIKEALKQPPDTMDELRRLKDLIDFSKELTGRSGGGNFGDSMRDMLSTGVQLMREAGNTVDKLRARDQVLVKMQRSGRPVDVNPVVQPVRKNGAAAPSSSQFASEQPSYPAGAEDKVRLIATAQSDVERIKTTIEAFQFLAQDAAWKPYFDQTVDLVRKNDRNALQFVRALLKNFVRASVITPDQAEATMKAFDTYWDDIRDRLFGAETEDDDDAEEAEGDKADDPAPV